MTAARTAPASAAPERVAEDRVAEDRAAPKPGNGRPADDTTGKGARTDDATLWAIEERFWTGGADSARRMTARGAVFVFPYPAGILQGNAIFREKDVAQRWRSVEMSDRYLSRRGEIAALAYRVLAERAGEPVLAAICSSSYLRDNGTWLRLTHQQTPDG